MTINQLAQLIEDYDILIDYTDVLSNLATALQIDNDYFIALNTRIHKLGTSRQMEILAHELGHCRRDIFIQFDLSKPFYQKLSQEIERAVTNFVIELLLPLNKLKKALRYTDDNLWNIADELGVRKELLDEAIDYYEQQGNLQRYFKTADCGCY